MGAFKKSLHKKISNLIEVAGDFRYDINNKLPFIIVKDINSKISDVVFNNTFKINLQVYRQLKEENIDETL